MIELDALFKTWKKILYMIWNLETIKHWISVIFKEIHIAIDKIKRQMIKWGKIFAPYIIKKELIFLPYIALLKIEWKKKDFSRKK